MEKNTKTSEAFREFTEKELENHLAELNTKYQNEPMSSKELIRKAYDEHKKIYTIELEEKENELLKNEKDESLKKELDNLKNEYVNKLNKVSEL